jgi:uncharacterized protein YutE (UPF0331/DUF86 family)
VADDVVLNKVATIERCLARVREEYRDDPARLDDQTIQDALVLNLQRACETAIDLAMHLVARGRLGLPQDSRDAFSLLQQAGLLEADLSLRLQRMVGFRNVVVHQYRQLSRPILLSIVRERLGDFEDFCRAAVRAPG